VSDDVGEGVHERRYLGLVKRFSRYFLAPSVVSSIRPCTPVVDVESHT
jgi:hypothetical protein